MMSMNNGIDTRQVFKSKESLKGAFFFLMLLAIIIMPLAVSSNAAALSSGELSASETMLFSCIEYDESYMTCSLGSMR